MELERARSLLRTERAQVQQLLADLGKARTDDHEAERDATYPAQPLAQRGVDDAVAPACGTGSRRSIGPSSGSKTGATVARSAAVLPSRTNAWRQTRRLSSPCNRRPEIRQRTGNRPADESG